MTAALKQRFVYARELRVFADRVEALELADRRDPEAPIVAKLTLAQEMRQRAAEVMKREDPTERGVFRSETVFAGKPGRPARPVAVGRAKARISGRLALAKAA